MFDDRQERWRSNLTEMWNDYIVEVYEHEDAPETLGSYARLRDFATYLLHTIPKE